jgi:hypothetical protein
MCVYNVTVRHEDEHKDTGEGDQNAKSLHCHSPAHFGGGGGMKGMKEREKEKKSCGTANWEN